MVPFGLPAERLAATPAVLRRAAELRAAHAGRKIVLFVGRLVYYKGVDVLVRAMAGVDADLVLIGRGPLEGELRELAAASGIAARVTFLAPQDDDELAAWYHAADVFCLPSVARSEAFGLVQIEAHAAGTPVVSTDLPTGVPYANLDGVTGLTVPPGDAPALARGAEPPARRRRAARAPRPPGAGARAARVHGPAHGRAARSTCTPRRPCAARTPRARAARATGEA